MTDRLFLSRGLASAGFVVVLLADPTAMAAPHAPSSKPAPAPALAPASSGLPTTSSGSSPPRPMSNEMRAETLFRSGEKKFDSGQYVEACNDFGESLRFGPKLGTLLNLAFCHEVMGRSATAWREFQYAAAWAAQNGQKDRHEFAMSHVLALEPKLPRVALQLPTDRAIASVEVDGEPVPESRWYLPLYLDPGEHAVAISVPGKKRGTVSFRVVDSPTEQLVMVPAPADDIPEPAPKVVSENPDPHHTRRLAGYVTLGAGVVGLAVGATFGIMALSKLSDVDAHCAGQACDAAAGDLSRDAHRDGTISTVSFVLGAAAAAVGGYIVLTSGPPKSAAAKLTVQPVAGGAFAGLSASF